MCTPLCLVAYRSAISRRSRQHFLGAVLGRIGKTLPSNTTAILRNAIVMAAFHRLSVRSFTSHSLVPSCAFELPLCSRKSQCYLLIRAV